ncbi:ribosomal RNA-processing protein 12 [Coprinopsis marcescibilis]|uniref:Ribosomal RNA-processing protein 12 n=1 Tax=Coprinopsis marcescibilis TaxID=230819 RepID=A0A5C3KTZ0_COPMA|nr:ribosomal RNA-processing protein 12 [Coprinopsis marcescibilis]
MEEALAKIRPHVSSNLSHQKTPAKLLVAVESTLKEQKTEPTATAYFAALLTILDGTIQKKELSLNDGDVLPAELYLLAFIIPFVPPPVLRAHLNTLLSLTAPLFPALDQHPPALRSQLAIYQGALKTVDRSQLEAQGIRQSFASILQLCIDGRPKVRKKATEVITDIISSPPAPLSIHPYSQRVAEWAISLLAEVASGPLSKSKASKQGNSPGSETGIHLLAFLRPALPHLPPSTLPILTKQLLSLPRLGNLYLTQGAYSLLADIFALPVEDPSVSFQDQLPEILAILLSSTPPKSDHNLPVAWASTVGEAMSAYNLGNPTGCSSEISKAWRTLWPFLESTETSVRQATANALIQIATCFSADFVKADIQTSEKKSTIKKLISQTSESLDSLAYSRAIPDILTVIAALIKNLRYRILKESPTAAELVMIPLIEKIGDLRVQKTFEYKEAADFALGIAMHVLGPEVLLKVLPLNLDPASRTSGEEPRAFLLPLLSQPHPSPLRHFIDYFVPLSEQMFELQQKAEDAGRHSEGKVWSVLTGQVWSGLVGYCWGSPDLSQSLDATFSQLISQLLYGQAELRPAILKALRTLVESNAAMATGNFENAPTTTITTEDAKKNLEYLSTQAESWLAVLFNVFGTVERDSRGMVGETISSWASVASKPQLEQAYRKVIDLYKTHLIASTRLTGRQLSGSNADVNMTTTAQDILLLLLPHLPQKDVQELFELSLSQDNLCNRDNGIQKRGYKTLFKISEDANFNLQVEEVVKRLDEFVDGLVSAAKKDRFSLLTVLVDRLPSTSFHVIPSLIPEAVLGTKEPSEKARTEAFDLIVAMGRKMEQGGVVKRSMIDGMDQDDAPDAVANVEEFMTMMAGGLAGASAHMISASITAISRLVFEFKDSISPNMHNEVLSTILVFLTSANREIVKSALGFTKLVIHTLSVDLLRPHLQELVSALLNWSHDHKNHFKVKVRHIFERLLRRFDFDEVYACAADSDAAKVLLNIKKRKERAKRKRASKDDDDEEQMPLAKPAVGDAFEDVLYGSESELGDSDDEDVPTNHSKKSIRKKDTGHVRLRIDDDDPTDLLHGVTSKVTNAAANRRRKPGQDASHFKTDDSTGKMVIDEGGSDEDDSMAVAQDVAGTAYKESLTSVDGFTRGPNGKVKFHKDTKKRRRQNDDEDVEMGDAEEPALQSKAKKPRSRTDPKFGHEFKAKKAGGDVKKNGVDPYAYLPLGQAAKRGKGRIGIAGKR